MWVVAGLAASAALAAVPLPVGWPLPIGLGGAIGDMIMRLPVFLVGDAFGLKIGIGVMFGFAAFAAVAMMLGWIGPKPETREERLARLAAYADEDDAESDGGGFMPLAMLHHWLLVGRANLLRLFGRRPSTLDNRGAFSLGRMVDRVRHRGEETDEDDWAEPAPRRPALRSRVEPSLDEDRRPEVQPQPRGARVVTPRLATAPMPAPAEVEDDDGYDDRGGYDDADERAFNQDYERDYDDRNYHEEEPPFDVDPPAPVPAPAPVARTAAAAPARPLRGPAANVQPPAAVEPSRRVDVTPAAKPLGQARSAARERVFGGPVSNEGYQFPPLTLLTEPKRLGPDASHSEDVLEQNARDLEGVLDDFGVKGEIIHVRPGPVVTLYELEPAPGVKSSRVIGLADDIARSMSAVSARVAVVPGRNVIGIELPNQRRETVYFREMIGSPDFQETKQKLAVCLGKTIGGEPVIADLARMPHLLVAGTTGSGKSVAINTMIMSLLYRMTPQQCKLIMVDPKMLELSVYDGIPHLLSPVVTDPKKAVVALKWAVREMEDRYRKMSKLGVRNIDGFNARVAEANARGEVLTREVQTGFDRSTGEPVYEQEELALEPLPYIVIIVDEMADLMMVAGKDIEGAIQRLAQMARAAGLHIIMATQRPSVDVITGTIKANFPTRISFQVTSKIDSRTILGEQGAEQLLGQGDMLYMAGGGRIQRVHGPFVSDDEVEKIVAHLKKQGVPQYLDAITASDDDEDGEGPGSGSLDGMEESGDLYDKAVAVVLRDRKASTSYVQRRLQIGYNRAASLIERMEKEGIVGPANHAGKREILVGGEE
ncbi:DNA translocase FtsK [Methyloraptor flagellatus]|uniref:DNA translocase FtsK n=1 Tax=Methyloraptor flagellatus TaxID=3162530 RepID=A0AAU7X9G2_9HYPH